MPYLAKSMSIVRDTNLSPSVQSRAKGSPFGSKNGTSRSIIELRLRHMPISKKTRPIE